MIWIVFIVVFMIFLYLKIVKPYDYWDKKGVKQRKQVYLFGDYAKCVFGRETFIDTFVNMYNAFPNERYIGIYQMIKPTLLLKDPDLIKQIAVKNFDHFTDHNSIIPPDNDPLFSRLLVTLQGDEWRQMRAILSPSFTSAKIKMIFNIISKCADHYLEYFNKTPEVKIVELKDLFTRYANDVIATAAFGIECDSINNQSNEFYIKGKELTTTSFAQMMIFFFFMVMPRISKLLGIKFFPDRLSNYFITIIFEAIKTRNEKEIVRSDMLQLLIEAKKGTIKNHEETPSDDKGFETADEIVKPEKSNHFEVTDIDIAAQAIIFFMGGFDTISTAMSFMGYELAINSDIQEKLQREIDETVKQSLNGKLTYEKLMKMKYMDMVVSETLRKWPPAIVADRVCTKKFIIEPVNLHEKTLELNPGDLTLIPISGIHRDPKYYPQPEKLDPERFSDENKEEIRSYTYIPFGVGPRNCIGSRFALLEVKCFFFHLLKNFDFVVVEKTEIPLQLVKNSFNLMAKNGTWIGLKPRINSFQS